MCRLPWPFWPRLNSPHEEFSVLRRNPIRVLFVFASFAVLSACQEAGPPPQPPAAVNVVILDQQKVTLTRELSGRTNAFVVAEVRPQVSGIIEERLFTEGSVVEEGEALYQLDDAVYRAELNSAKANLARAKAAMEIARLDAERAKELVGTGAVSRREYDTANSTLEQRKAEVALAEANLERAQVTLNYARITSPTSGRIGRSAVTQGALVTANQPQPLAIVQQLDPIYVDLNQSSAELLEMRKAMQAGSLNSARDLPVTVLLEDGSRFDHEGTLAFSEVSVDPTTGSYLLRVVVPNPDYVLMPGMYVRAVLARGVVENAILVPQQAVSRDPRGRTNVMVLTEDNVVELRSIQVSSIVGDQWLVEAGLSAGERVIVEGLQKVQPGDSVPAENIGVVSNTVAQQDQPGSNPTR